MFPETSILIPTYNNGQFLMECIGSILRQEYQDYEIVIIDDHSTDNTQKMMGNLMQLDNRIKYYKNENHQKGLVSALNFGINNICKGEFIARMDADDIMLGQRLFDQIKFLKENTDVQCVCSSMQLIDENGIYLSKALGNSNIDECRLLLLFCNMYVHATMTCRKSVLLEFKYNPYYFRCEDYELWTRLTQKYTIKHLSDIHHSYRIYNNPSKSSNSTKERNKKILELLSNLLNYYKIQHTGKELILLYSLFHSEIKLGNKDEIKNLLNKIFKSKVINQKFNQDVINKIQLQLISKFVS